MSVILIIIIGVFLFWPWIVKWLQRYMARRAEDMVRRMAGMPPRKEEERRRRQQQRQRKESGARAASEGFRSRRRHNSHEGDGVEMMKQYAEDVEFVEIKEYSSSELLDGEERAQRRVYRESQVSDVEYTEFKTGGRGGKSRG